MRIETKQDYIDSLKKLKPRVYLKGKKVEDVTENPAIIPHINSAAMTYELANYDEYKELLTVYSSISEQTISRFTHIHESVDDLIKKVKCLRLIGQKTGACFQRCVGWDAMNAVFNVTFEMDQKNGTEYHQRFLKFLKYVQASNIMVSGSMTDPKGDRSHKPADQEDPDLYTHIVEKRKDGIVIRGAKAHNTGVVNSHEMLLMPTTALDENNKAYAVCCAVPVDAEGVTHIFGRQSNDMRRYEPGEIDKGNVEFGMVGGEALTVLDDVFVPWERVFMCEDYEFAYPLVEMFATYHRSNYGACKTGVADCIIGAAAAIAEYNGTEKAGRIKELLIDMNFINETLYAGSIACAAEASKTPAGKYYVDPLLANITKLNVTKSIYEISRLSHDIAGGALATLPCEEDFKSPEVGHYVDKYFKGNPNVSTEDRIKMFRFIENLTGGTALAEAMHGAGSPAAQRVMIYRQSNLAHKKKIAKMLAGTEGYSVKVKK